MALIPDPDILTWGRLVKSWASRLDYINTPPAKQPPSPPAGNIPPNAQWALPPLNPVSFNTTIGTHTEQKTIPGVLWMTPEQFLGKVQAAGVSGVNFQPGLTDVIIVQGDRTTLILRLPSASVMQTAEDWILAGQPYPTPTFYDALYSPPGGPMVHANPPTLPAVDKLMELHANRIGDYVMGLCQ